MKVKLSMGLSGAQRLFDGSLKGVVDAARRADAPLRFPAFFPYFALVWAFGVPREPETGGYHDHDHSGDDAVHHVSTLPREASA